MHGTCIKVLNKYPRWKFPFTLKIYEKRSKVKPVTYVVWQKSNETGFLLTMNFILFTNQGYPLQNSSLGQLHNDGGIVSIVRSSAGRLLLVCYAFLDIIQSTKMAPFQVVFEPRE